MEAIIPFQTAVNFYQTSWLHISEDFIFNSHCLEDQISQIQNTIICLFINCSHLWVKGWTAGVRFQAGARDFSLLHRVQTCSGAHPAYYPMGTGVSFPRGCSGRGVKLTIALHLVLRSSMMELYLHSPIRLHGVVLNCPLRTAFLLNKQYIVRLEGLAQLKNTVTSSGIEPATFQLVA
jgi:hypothetical protein